MSIQNESLPGPSGQSTELAGPIAESGRLQALDVARGAAVLGILVMNI